MESIRFESWTFRFETGNITAALLLFDYITAIFTSYNLSTLLADCPSTINHKMFINELKSPIDDRCLRKYLQFWSQLPVTYSPNEKLIGCTFVVLTIF